MSIEGLGTSGLHILYKSVTVLSNCESSNTQDFEEHIDKQNRYRSTTTLSPGLS